MAHPLVTFIVLHNLRRNCGPRRLTACGRSVSRTQVLTSWELSVCAGCLHCQCLFTEAWSLGFLLCKPAGITSYPRRAQARCGQAMTHPRSSTRRVHMGYFVTFHHLSGWPPSNPHPSRTEGLSQEGTKSSKALAIRLPFSLSKDLTEPPGFCLRCASCLSLLRSPHASSCYLEGNRWLTLALQLFYFHNYRSQSQALMAALQPCGRALSFVIDIKALDPSFPRAMISCWVTAMAKWGNGVCIIWLFFLLAVADHIRNGISERWWAAARNWRVEKIQAGWRKGQGREWGKAGTESGKLGAGQTRLM